MKESIYKKIIIESEKDLPEEEGYYFVGVKSMRDGKVTGEYGSMEYYDKNIHGIPRSISGRLSKLMVSRFI